MDELDSIIKQINEEFGEGTITTANEIPRPQSSLDREAFDDFNTRNPMAGGGRINFYKGMSANKAPKKIKLKEPVTLTGKAGDRKLTAKQIDALDPNYLGDFTGGDLERPKKVYKSGTPNSIIDDAIEIRNVIVNNKGNIFNLEELGEKTGLFTRGTGTRKSGKGNRPDNRTVKAALEIAKDNFPEIANFKFVTDRYKIDGKQRQQLNMVVDTIKAYQNSTGNDKLANFLPENMGTFYKRVIEKGPKKLPANPEQGLYIKMYNFGPEQIRYISDRITDETGQTFTSKDYKNLITDVKKYRASVASDKAQFTRAIEMNADIKKLYDDKVIQNLIRGDLDNKAKKQILNRAVNLLGDDISVASKRLFMMAQSIAGTRPIDGISVEKDLGKKIIDTQRLVGKAGNGYAFSGLVYDHYGKVIDQALNSPKGKSFIGYYQKEIRNALDKGLVPDEIFSVTASARRGLEPYAIFTQALNADVNSRIKGASLDSLLSTTHRNLQNIFQGRTYDKLNTAEKKAVQDLVTTYENAKKDVVKDLKPNIRKTIQLPEFDLKNPPSKSIANYKSYDSNLQSAFDRSYKNVGYSMKVTKDMQTQKEFLNKLYASFSANPKCRVTFGKGQKEGGRIGYATGPANLVDCADSGKKRLEKVIKTGVKLGPQEGALATQILKAGRALGSGLTLSGMFGPAAIAFTALAEAGLVGYDMLSEGKTFREAVGDSLFNYALGEKTKIDPQEELFKRFKGLGYDNEQMFRIKKALDTANTINTGMNLGMDIVNQKAEVDKLGKKYEQDSQQIMMPDDEMMQSDELFRAQQKEKDLMNQMAAYNEDLSAVAVGDTEAKEDMLNKYIQSGDYAQGLELFSNADRLAEIEKTEKALENPFAGRLRIDELSNKLRELKLNDPRIREYMGPFPTTYGFNDGGRAGFTAGGYGKDAAKYIKEIETDHHKGYQYYKRHGGKKSFKQYMRESMSKYFAGGGIAGLSGGDPEGAMTRSMNPDSQGLSYLFNRVKKT